MLKRLESANVTASPRRTQCKNCRLRVEQLEDRTVPDTNPATMLDPNLQVTTVVPATAGLSQPIGIVFLSTNDFFVLEKASGQIKRVTNGVVQPTPALDLAVNSASERGVLSMVLHPNFPTTPFVYVRWTESSTGADTTTTANVPLLGNRVDRYVWNGSTLTFDRNIITLRSRQSDNIAVTGHPGTNNPAENGNHNGGVMRFGPDGKLYLFMGDQGRRGWLQNLPNGPFLTAPQEDDTFGGPAPDNAHLTGVILRLNDDGTTPADNPFFAAGAAIGGEVGANIQKIYSYGHRNGFGMAFDPVTGALWETENADDAYSELNHIIPGMNGGWVQFAGPISRIADWKFIETTQFGGALQQVRYPPTRAAYTAAQALSQMFMLPGATYVDPDFSWRYEIGPAGTTFLTGNALGPEYNGTLWMGSARSNAMVGANGGSLYRFRMTPDRMHVDVSADPRLADRVADNVFRPQKFDGTESETLQIGTGFGITPDIEQGPDGNLYVVSNTDNVIYKISRVTPGPQPKPPGRNGGGSKFDGQLSESPSFGRVAIDLDRMSSVPSFGDSMAGVSPLTISTKQLLSSDNQLSLRSFEESVRQSSKRSEDVRDSNTRIAGQGWHPLLGTGLTTNDCADTEST
jgi:glucose/arabinose dehydrogenase